MIPLTAIEKLGCASGVNSKFIRRLVIAQKECNASETEPNIRNTKFQKIVKFYGELTKDEHQIISDRRDVMRFARERISEIDSIIVNLKNEWKSLREKIPKERIEEFSDEFQDMLRKISFYQNEKMNTENMLRKEKCTCTCEQYDCKCPCLCDENEIIEYLCDGSCECSCGAVPIFCECDCLCNDCYIETIENPEHVSDLSDPS